MLIPIPAFFALWALATIAVAGLALAMFNARADANIQRRINQHNDRKHNELLTTLYQDVCDRRNIRPLTLPAINSKMYYDVCDLYDHPDFMAYTLPVAFTPSNDGNLAPIFYWRRYAEDFDARELTHLWLIGVLV